MSEPSVLRSGRILVVDDNPSIHDDIRKILRPEGTPETTFSEAKSLLFGGGSDESLIAEFEIDSAFQGADGIQMVQAAIREGCPYSLAFVDVRMPPGMDGIETVTRIWQHQPDLQVVICTAYSDYSWEDMVGQLGRSPSMVVLKKPFDNIEVLQLAHALTEKWRLGRENEAHIRELDARVAARTSDLTRANEQLTHEISERQTVERALVLSEEQFSKAFNANPIPLAIQSAEGERFTEVNRGFENLTGLSREALIGHTPAELGLMVDPDHCRLIALRLRTDPSIRNSPCQLRTKTGEVRDIILSVETVELSGHPHLLTILEDVTEHLLLEKQLRHSQKMEAVGQLASGIAHDFNNMLTVIQGNASLILSGKPAEADRPMLESILRSAQRSAKLVRQLLAFSHKQMMEVKSVNVADMLASLADMLPRMLGEQVDFSVDSPRDLPEIAADPAMLEQALLSLAVNARDAMPRGGRLTIGATITEITAADLRTNQDASEGRFLRIEVSDTGEGIAPDVLPRIFEPFFTTKPIGKGTGLGLATVYGIAKQHEGWIDVRSEVGKGATFVIFIPAKEPPAGNRKAEAQPEHTTTRADSGTILLVEDEDAVRKCVHSILKARGYTVFTACNGVEALAVWKQHHDKIDLLLTDMVMPEGLTGLDLAEQITAERPDLKVIYTSGYSSEIADPESRLPPGHRFLAKPYQSDQLTALLRETLGSGQESTGQQAGQTGD